MAKKIRVVEAGTSIPSGPKIVVATDNVPATKLTSKEIQVRMQRKFATSTTFGGLRRMAGMDTIDSGTSQFYSPQLSTDFLEKPQNLRERRAFYRFFYNSNEIVGRAIDIHSTLPLSKLRLIPPKGKNPHQNKYVMKYFEDMCDGMKLFKTLLEIAHDYNLFGNCLAGSAEVRVLSGYKKASDIQEGDLVLTNRGRFRKVLKTCHRPSEKILKIHCCKDFREIPVTEEHPVEVLENGGFVFKQAKDVSTNDYIRVTWPTEVCDVTREDCEKVTVRIDNDFSYLVGYWLGNGTLTGDNNSRDTWSNGLWQISFNEKEIGNIDRVRKILAGIFGGDSIIEWTSDRKIYLKVISNPTFVEWWAENFGETSFGKNNKKIPHWFVRLPAEKLRHFLAGLVDSSGMVSVSENCVVAITATTRSIMDSVRDVSFKCGAVANYTGMMSTLTSRPMYTLTVSDEDSCRIFTEYSTKMIPEDSYFCAENRFWQKTEDGVAFKVRSIITEDYNDFVYNFEVEEDHTYQVAGFSTHNCFLFCQEENTEEELNPDQLAKKREEASQRSVFLKEKYQVIDKNPLYKGWEKLIVLPPDQVRVRKLPLTDDVAIEYVPDPQTKEFITQGGYTSHDSPDGEQKKYSIPSDLRDKVRQSGAIPLDTDPYSGSFCFHLARKKSQYEPLGVSMIERCINTLVLLDKLRQAQTSIASRHMTPMRIVWAEQLSVDDVDNLREQVDLALVDPDYSIVANYEIHWEEMGSSGRLLDIEGENTAGMDRLLAGLGMTREILTGEGSYTGSRISLEIMNTEYLLFREVIQDFIENYLFKPVAKRKGFVEFDDYGNEVILYPKLSFTRLAIRDNDHFFDSAFQLYQKGSLSIDLLLDILNIDPVSTREKLEKDMFTVNDSIFNEVLRNLYTNAAAKLTEETDITDKLAKYMKLNKVEVPAGEPGAKRFAAGKAPEVSAEDREKAVKIAKIAKFLGENPELLDRIFKNVQDRGKSA